MKKINELDQRGPYGADIASINPTMAYGDEQYTEPVIVDLTGLSSCAKKKPQGGHYRVGNISEDQVDDAKEAEQIQQLFSQQIHSIITSSIQGKKIKGKMKGNKQYISLVSSLLSKENEYLTNLFSGKAADAPQLIKLKAEIDKLAGELKRNTGLEWPFK